jgi:hypothetical protein
MTESDWLGESRPEHALSRIRQRRKKTHLRKYRLLMCALCREISPSLLSRTYRHALDTAERFAEGDVAIDDLTRIVLPDAQYLYSDKAVKRLRTYTAVRTACETHNADRLQFLAWYALVCMVATTSAQTGEDPTYPPEAGRQTGWPAQLLQQWGPSASKVRARQATQVRDIFGNPFRPVAFDPGWRTSDAVALARAIYDERSFDRLPILADALMDAGCEDEQVIEHCRSEGTHVRGCWVVDLVLEKE